MYEAKKSGVSIETPHSNPDFIVLAGTSAAGAASTAVGAAAAAAAAATADRLLGFDNETVVGHVDLHFSGLGKKFLINEEGESTGLEHFVFIVRLIQSQSQARACSASSREIYADRGRLFILEVAFKLFLCSFGKFKH